jgi:hypothetical protein
MAVNELGEPVQNDPIQEGSHDATNAAKVQGILQQVRSDVGMGHVDDARNVLLERLSQAGAVVGDAELDDLVRQISED